MIEVLRNRAGFACFIAVWIYRFGCLAVHEGAIRGEQGRGVDSEYCGITGSINVSFSTIALNGILDPVEEQRTPQEFKQLSCSRGWDVGLEVEKVEVGLVMNFSALRSWDLIQLLGEGWGKMGNGEGICWVVGELGAG